MNNLEFWIGFAGIIITIIGATVRITRFISKQNEELTQLVYRKFNEARLNLDSESGKLRLEFGETLKALKVHVERYEEKLYQVEIYIRDNYIEVPTFKDIIDDIKKDIRDLSGKLDHFRIK